MADKITVGFAESSLCDLEQLQAWYRERGAPEIGRRFVAEIIQRIEGLRQNPDMGRMVPEFGKPFLRELIHPPFRIVHRRDPGHIRVVCVWRSERLLNLPHASLPQE